MVSVPLKCVDFEIPSLSPCSGLRRSVHGFFTFVVDFVVGGHKSLSPSLLVPLLCPSQFFLLPLHSTEPTSVGVGGAHLNLAVFLSLLALFADFGILCLLSFTQGVVRCRISGLPFCNFMSFGENCREVGDSCALPLSSATWGSSLAHEIRII